LRPSGELCAVELLAGMLGRAFAQCVSMLMRLAWTLAIALVLGITVYAIARYVLR
jgi:hypothetical protein